MEENTEIGVLDLPPDVTLHIFKFINLTDLLYSVRKTCKQWDQLSREKSLWRTLNITDFPNHAFTPKSFLELLRDIEESVESLYFDLTHHDLKVIRHEGTLCINVKEICVGQYRKSNADGVISTTDLNNGLLRLSEKYPNLTKLHLINQVLLYENIFNNLEVFVYESFDRSVGRIKVSEFLHHHLKLKHITLRGCILSVDTVTKLLTGYSQLETLDLCGSLFVQGELNYEFSLDDMKVENLRTLNLNGTDIVDGFLQKIARKSKCLEFINITKCPRITNSAIEVVASYCANLRTLIISDDERNSEGGHCDITGAGIERIAENCHKLTVLKMNDCPEVCDKSVASIINGCPELEEFEVSGCLSLQDATILSLVNKCVKIRRLNLGNCPRITGKSVSSVLRYCTKLKYLNIETCNRVTDLDILDDDSSLTLGKTKGGQDMELELRKAEAGMEVLEPDAEVEFDSVKDKQHDNEVEKVEAVPDLLDKDSPSDHNLCDNSEISKSNNEVQLSSSAIKLDTSLSKVSERNLMCELYPSSQYLKLLSNHSHVRVLNLSFCSGITNSCIKQLAWHCPDLRELDITACYMITNAGVRELVQNCKFLQSLNISGGSVTQTSRLTDGCLDDIVRYGKNLKKLIVQKNYNITADGVLNIVQNCEEIYFICVEASRRSNLSKEMLIDLMGMVKNKTICLKLKASVLVEITVFKDAELKIEKSFKLDSTANSR